MLGIDPKVIFHRLEIVKLKAARFIREVNYTTWLSNILCSKDSYPLPSIDRLVDGALGFQVLNFLDVYFGYNLIKMYPPNANKISFMMNEPTYYYHVMSFDLKNVGAIYQHLMDKVFTNHISCNLEVYVDNIVVKSFAPEEHIKDLEEIFA
ncbi:hypothetical protein CR513_42912, partial [Mucuna pruriens]